MVLQRLFLVVLENPHIGIGVTIIGANIVSLPAECGGFSQKRMRKTPVVGGSDINQNL